MNKVNWTAVAVFGIVVLVAFLIGVSLLGGGWGYGGWGMMGPGMMGGWDFGPFGWIAMIFAIIFMWLVPIGFVVLTVLGVVWLVHSQLDSDGWQLHCHPRRSCTAADHRPS